MNIKNKIIPIALSLFIGVGSLGIANAAIPVDSQAKMASWIKNDPNPMPMNMNMNMNSVPINNIDTTKFNLGITNAANNTDTSKKNKTNINISGNSSPSNIATGKQNYTNPNMNNDLYNQMMQNCIQIDQQMMQNMTPEQMLEMDKIWYDTMSKNQQQVQPNTKTPSQSRNSNRAWNNYNCGW